MGTRVTKLTADSVRLRSRSRSLNAKLIKAQYSQLNARGGTENRSAMTPAIDRWHPASSVRSLC